MRGQAVHKNVYYRYVFDDDASALWSVAEARVYGLLGVISSLFFSARFSRNVRNRSVSNLAAMRELVADVIIKSFIAIAFVVFFK